MRSIARTGIASLAALTLALASAPAAAATTLTFDDLPGSPEPVPNGYGGLNWDNMWVTNGPSQGGGYANGTVSGSNVAFNAFGDAALILESSTPFDLLSGYFTAAWNDGLNVMVTGYSGVTPIYSTSFTLNTSGPSLETFNWTGLTSVRFISSGGTHNDNYIGTGTHFALDNLTVDLTSAVPEPASWAMMLFGFGAIGSAMRRREATAALI